MYFLINTYNICYLINTHKNSNIIIFKICRALGSEYTENFVLVKILELIYDHEIDVKLSAIKLLFNLCDLLHEEI